MFCKLGAPGKSAGLEIASRLGLSEDLIARARQRMSTSERDIAVFLNELHQRLRRTAVEEQDLREQRQALEAREQTLAKEFEQREKAKFKELDERLRSALAEFEAQTQETDSEGAGWSGAAQSRRAGRAPHGENKREFEEKARVAVFGEAPVPQQRFVPIEEGARVRLKGVREPARVRRKLSGGLLEVEAGLMRMKVTTDDVEEVLPAAPRTRDCQRMFRTKPARAGMSPIARST
jgi:DNA mismatch repair protein MutS2